MSKVPQVISLGQACFSLVATLLPGQSNGRALSCKFTHRRNAFTPWPQAADRWAGRTGWFGAWGHRHIFRGHPEDDFRWTQGGLYFQDQTQDLQGSWAQFSVGFKGRAFQRALLQLGPMFCMPHIPEIHMQVDLVPDFEGTAPSSKKICGSLLYAGNHSRCI